MPEIHVTDRQNFKRCRRRWDWECREHLHPTKEVFGALWFGRGMHYALADLYKGLDPFKGLEFWWNEVLPAEEWNKLSYEAKVEVTEMKTLQYAILEHYLAFYGQTGNRDQWEVIAVERELRARIPGTKSILVGTLDLLVKWKGRLWVVDHKNLADFADPAYLELDDQMTAYMWLVYQEYGEIPAGAIYNQLRKRAPKPPKILKSGELSQDKAQITSHSAYLKAIYDNNLNPADYENHLLWLKTIDLEDNKFFRREVVTRNKKELSTFQSQLPLEVREMTSKNLMIYHNPTKDCAYDCSFRALCKATNEGGDTDGIKGTLFFVQEGRLL